MHVLLLYSFVFMSFFQSFGKISWYIYNHFIFKVYNLQRVNVVKKNVSPHFIVDIKIKTFWCKKIVDYNWNKEFNFTGVIGTTNMNCKWMQILFSFSISEYIFYELYFHILNCYTFYKFFLIASDIYENIWFLLSQFTSELRLIAKENDDSRSYFKKYFI